MASPSVSPTTRTRPTSPPDPANHLTPTDTTWTPDQEARLVYCQDQLKQAQKKWSDRQELWIREVEHLLDLKRTYKKAAKKQDKARRRASRLIWRPLSRTQSNVEAIVGGNANGNGVIVDEEDCDGEKDEDGEGDGDRDEDGDEEDGDEEDMDDVGGSVVEMKRRAYSLPLRTTSLSSSLSSPTSPTRQSPIGRNPFKAIIRRMSSSSYRGLRGRVGSVVEEADGA